VLYYIEVNKIYVLSQIYIFLHLNFTHILISYEIK